MSNNRLKEIRKLRKMTQVELAEILGVSHSAVQKIESGVVDLDLTWMQKLSVVLDVKPYELLPTEWQPEEITPREREILRMIRKTTAPQGSDNSHTSAPAEDKADTQKSQQLPQKSNER